MLLFSLIENCINRRYTKFYGTQGDSAADIARDAILGKASILSSDNERF